MAKAKKKALKSFSIEYKLVRDINKVGKSNAPFKETVVKAKTLAAAKKKAKNDGRVVTDGWEILDTPQPMEPSEDYSDSYDDNDNDDNCDCIVCRPDLHEDEIENDNDNEDADLTKEVAEVEVAAAPEVPTEPTDPRRVKLAQYNAVLAYLGGLMDSQDKNLAIQSRAVDILDQELNEISDAKEELAILDVVEIVTDAAYSDFDYGSETPVPDGFEKILEEIQEGISKGFPDSTEIILKKIAERESEVKNRLDDYEESIEESNQLSEAFESVYARINAKAEAIANELDEEEFQRASEAAEDAAAQRLTESFTSSVPRPLLSSGIDSEGEFSGFTPTGDFAEYKSTDDQDNGVYVGNDSYAQCNCIKCWSGRNWIFYLIAVVVIGTIVYSFIGKR